jgi:hypothetical protein
MLNEHYKGSTTQTRNIVTNADSFKYCFKNMSIFGTSATFGHLHILGLVESIIIMSVG